MRTDPPEIADSSTEEHRWDGNLGRVFGESEGHSNRSRGVSHCLRRDPQRLSPSGADSGIGGPHRRINGSHTRARCSHPTRASGVGERTDLHRFGALPTRPIARPRSPGSGHHCPGIGNPPGLDGRSGNAPEHLEPGLNVSGHSYQAGQQAPTRTGLVFPHYHQRQAPPEIGS